MSTHSKHSYRFGFLKSEEWRGMRKLFLARAGATCFICDHKDWSNDVHHLRYPKKWNKTTYGCVVILCRRCHRHIHDIFGSKMPTKNVYEFVPAAREAYRTCGPEFTSTEMLLQLAIVRSPKFEDRRRFRRICRQISKFGLTPRAFRV